MSFRECLFRGLAPDGGMYLPADLPHVSQDQLLAWAGLSYKQLCVEILQLFVSEAEIPRAALVTIIDRAFGGFTHPDVVPIKHLPAAGLHVAELWHGPTLAFKDLGLQIMGAMIDWYLKQSGEHATVLVGTSGDTGSAAIHGVLGCDQVDIVVLYPRGRTSRTQACEV